MILFLIDHNKPGTWDLGPRSRPLRIAAEWKWEPKMKKDDKDPSGKRESMIRLAAEGIYCNETKLRATLLPSEPRTH